MTVKTAVIPFLLLCILVACCSCSITTDSNLKYSFVEIKNGEGDLYLSSGSFYSADADVLRSYSEISYSKNIPTPTNAKEAAQTGASILDMEYDSWSESNTVAVYYNKSANAWIVHGQLPNRNCTGKTGVIAIEATTGEVLCIALETSGT